jgi:hypothetical protein
MNHFRFTQRWLLRWSADLLLDLICNLLEQSDGTVALRVSTIAELAKALVAGDVESISVNSTHSIVGSAIDQAVPQAECLLRSMQLVEKQ